MVNIPLFAGLSYMLCMFCCMTTGFTLGGPRWHLLPGFFANPWLEMMMAPSVATFFNAVPGADRMFSLKKLPLGMQTWTRRDRSFHHFCIPKNLMWSRSGFFAPLCLTVSTRPCKAHILVTDVLTTSDNILAVYQYQCQHIFATSYPTFLLSTVALVNWWLEDWDGFFSRAMLVSKTVGQNVEAH